MTFVVGKLRASALNDLLNENSPFSLGILARGKRTTNSTTTTTEVGVLRLDDVPIQAGRTYLIYTSTLLADSSVANDGVEGLLRYTTDGSTPTTSSTILAQTVDVQTNAAQSTDVAVIASYTPAADETLSVLLTVARTTGTGNVGLLGAATTPIELFIEDKGLDVTDTGVDV